MASPRLPAFVAQRGCWLFAARLARGGNDVPQYRGDIGGVTT